MTFVQNKKDGMKVRTNEHRSAKMRQDGVFYSGLIVLRQ